MKRVNVNQFFRNRKEGNLMYVETCFGMRAVIVFRDISNDGYLNYKLRIDITEEENLGVQINGCLCELNQVIFVRDLNAYEYKIVIQTIKIINMIKDRSPEVCNSESMNFKASIEGPGVGEIIVVDDKDFIVRKSFSKNFSCSGCTFMNTDCFKKDLPCCSGMFRIDGIDVIYVKMKWYHKIIAKIKKIIYKNGK